MSKSGKNAASEIGLTETEKEAKKYFSKLLNWRKSNSAITNGNFKHYAPQKNDVYIYFRYNNEQKVMVLLNKNSENVTLNMNRYSEMISNKFKAKDIILDKEFDVENILTISGKTAMILEIR